MVRKLSALIIFVAGLSTGVPAPKMDSTGLPAASGVVNILPGDPDEPTQTPIDQPTPTPTPVPTGTLSTDTPSPTATFTPTSTPTPTDTATPTAVPLATKASDVLTQACVEANRLLIWTLSRLFFLDRSQVIKWFCESNRFRQIQSYNPPGDDAHALLAGSLEEDRVRFHSSNNLLPYHRNSPTP